MGRSKKPKAKRVPQNSQRPNKDSNFVADAGPGCYIVPLRDSKSRPSFLIGWEDVDPEDYEGMEIPDVAVDDEELTLSLCNVDDTIKIAYVSVLGTNLMGADGVRLKPGLTVNNQGESTDCITFIVHCPPRVFCHLCYLDVSPANLDLSELRIESDVQVWNEHPLPSDEHPQRVGFPLEGGPFLCTQGENGSLTHFFSGNLHAIDFRCPVGTPLLAVGDGRVLESKDINTLSGIAVSNLFEWNSILIELDETTPTHDSPAEGGGSLVVEYVHIQKSLVQKGDRVSAGQVIGYSGSVGFSPEPHLHFSAFRSAEPSAPTVRVRFQGITTEDGTDVSFLPRAGSWYDKSGCTKAS